MAAYRRVCAAIGLALFLCGTRAAPALVGNLAMVTLNGYIASPSGSADDPRVARVLRLFGSSERVDRERYGPYVDRVLGIAEQNLTPQSRAYLMGRSALEAGHLSRQRGSQESARLAYREASLRGTEQIRLEAHLWLADLLREHGDAAGSRAEMERAAAVMPYALSDAPCYPDVREVRGYVDLHDLALQRPVHIIVVWQFESELELST